MPLKKKKRKQNPIFSNLGEIFEDSVLKKSVEQDPGKDVDEPVEYVEPVVHIEPATHIKEIPFTFVKIKPGAFIMGSPEYEAGRNDDEIPHEVKITGVFHMQTTPVTLGQWKKVMGSIPSGVKADGFADDFPVVLVSWNECQSFIRRLNRLDTRRYRLPSEAEWEYACRAGSMPAFCGGEISECFQGHDKVLDELGWYAGNSNRRMHPVARKRSNDWGLHDMHGGVMEWCLDWYGEYSPEPQSDPGGAYSGQGRVVRGGSWFANARNCRSASRFHWSPDSRSDLIGFRLVREG